MEANDWWHVAIAVTEVEKRVEERRGENERGRFRE